MFTFIVFSVLIWWAMACTIWPKIGLGTRRKWPRPRRDRDVCLPRPRRDRDVDNFSPDEIATRRWYVSRPRRRDRDHNPAM